MTTFGLKNSENQIIEFVSSLLSAAVFVPVCSEAWIKKPKSLALGCDAVVLQQRASETHESILHKIDHIILSDQATVEVLDYQEQ